VSDATRRYGKGWRAPWRGQWGGFEDGNTKSSRLARRIERELLAEYEAVTPLERRRLCGAARMLAMVERVMRTLGTDPKATLRRATSLQREADRQLAALRRRPTSPTGNGHAAPAVSVRRFGAPA
jgi:hypothetical protein